MDRDKIEKKVLLNAPLDRVWSAISDSAQFGIWFGVRFEGPFVAGELVKGKIVPTRMDAAVAEKQKPCEGMACDVQVERLEAKRHLSFRWHPGADPGDGSTPMTLVAFDLEEANGGTLLTITESGFEQLPLELRAKAFTENEGGWEIQCTLISKYLGGA